MGQRHSTEIKVTVDQETIKMQTAEELEQLALKAIQIEKVVISLSNIRSTVGKQSNNYFQSISLNTQGVYKLLEGNDETTARKIIAKAIKDKTDQAFKFARTVIKEQMTLDGIQVDSI